MKGERKIRQHKKERSETPHFSLLLLLLLERKDLCRTKGSISTPSLTPDLSASELQLSTACLPARAARDIKEAVVYPHVGIRKEGGKLPQGRREKR